MVSLFFFYVYKRGQVESKIEIAKNRIGQQLVRAGDVAFDAFDRVLESAFAIHAVDRGRRVQRDQIRRIVKQMNIN